MRAARRRAIHAISATEARTALVSSVMHPGTKARMIVAQ